MTRIAIILFPGSNDDVNSQRAAQAAGMHADIVRWNEPQKLEAYDGYVLPGGWSYEDRIRAGVIAAHDTVMEVIASQAARGKPVLGICNGAQILIEAGLVPGAHGGVEMALAPNANPLISGYYSSWVHIKATGTCAFMRELGTVLAIPVAHGEGKFTTRTPGLIDDLARKGQIIFQYCDADGTVSDEFPISPNGAAAAIAAISNQQGNVLAIMPHPERASWQRQLPENVGGDRRTNERAPARVVFENMRAYIEGRK
jgi:phosphoribosylformylglycinamidine synthase